MRGYVCRHFARLRLHRLVADHGDRLAQYGGRREPQIHLQILADQDSDCFGARLVSRRSNDDLIFTWRQAVELIASVATGVDRLDESALRRDRVDLGLGDAVAALVLYLAPDVGRGRLR